MSMLTVVPLVVFLASFSRVLGDLDCPAPGVIMTVSPSDSGHSLVTKSAEVAKNTALCHVACLNLVFQDITVCIALNVTLASFIYHSFSVGIRRRCR